MSPGPWLPHLPFVASTPAERAAQARTRFFHEGQRPTGLVDEAVLQSWQRCLADHRQPDERLSVDPVSRLRLDTALRRTRKLREAAQGELQHLERALAATHCTILLLDAQGMVVYASSPGAAPQSALIRTIARPGVDASERALGTNAPGLVLRTGLPAALDSGQHYFDQIAAMNCAAAPIRDIHGQIAGVLDLTVEHTGFGFDASVLVGLHAAAMERSLLQVQSLHQTLVELHVHPQALGAPGAGLLGLDDAGCVAWLDAAARRFTGARGNVVGEAWSCEQVLGLAHGRLLDLARCSHPTPLALPNGLSVWLRVRAPQGRAPDAPCPPPPPPMQPAPAPAPPPSLADHDRALILQTLQACEGNVSEVARRLGISRGRVYRVIATDLPTDLSTDISADS